MVGSSRWINCCAWWGSEASSTMRIFLFMVPLLVLAGFASIKGSSVYNGRDSIAKRYALSSSLITRSNFSSQTFLPPPNSSLQTIYPSSNSSLQTLHQSNETEVNVSIPKSNSAPANESDESHPREKQKRKPSFLDRTEVVLAQARATIREAKNWNLTQDSDYVPIGPMYWNAKEFHRYIMHYFFSLNCLIIILLTFLLSNSPLFFIMTNYKYAL